MPASRLIGIPAIWARCLPTVTGLLAGPHGPVNVMGHPAMGKAHPERCALLGGKRDTEHRGFGTPVLFLRGPGGGDRQLHQDHKSVPSSLAILWRPTNFPPGLVPKVREEADTGPADSGSANPFISFKKPGMAAIASQSSEGALDHPAFGQILESCGESSNGRESVPMGASVVKSASHADHQS